MRADLERREGGTKQHTKALPFSPKVVLLVVGVRPVLLRVLLCVFWALAVDVLRVFEIRTCRKQQQRVASG